MTLLDCFPPKRRPSIHIATTNTYVVGGQSHTIACSVSSILGITDLTWIKKTAVGTKIVIVVGVDGKFSGGTLSDPSLTINNISKSDEGIYVCTATDRFGITSSEDSVLTCNDEADSLSKEENNFLRLYLLCQKIATNAVRLFFDSEVPGDTLESFLKRYKSNLTCRIHGYKCTKDQEKKLFPGGQVVAVSTDFDFSLLYKLIRNCLPAIHAPTCGWGYPLLRGHAYDTDNIEIFRNFRNILNHNTKFEISDTDFSTHWTDLSQAIVRLSKGGLSTDVESMRTKTFDKCIKNKMEEDRRNELKEIREECMEIRQGVAECKTDIADNRQEIHNINTRHIPLNIRDDLIRIPEEENITDNVRAKLNSVINEIPVEQTGNRGRIMITPAGTVKTIKYLIEVIELDFSQANNARHGAHFYGEVRKNVENSGVFTPSDQSIDKNMIRYLPDGMTNKEKMAYYKAITDLTKTLIYMVAVGISVLSENELTHILNQVKVCDRNEAMKKLLQEITTIKQDCRRSNFRRCMQYMSAYYSLCVLWDMVVLYLRSIFSINSGHSNNITNAEMDLIDQQRCEDKEPIQCLVRPQKENVIFALLYTPDQWLPVKAFLHSRDMKSEHLDHLCSGHFQITSLAYRSSKVYMSGFGKFLRWSRSNYKFTNFTFRNKIEGGKTYFHIFSADYPNHYVKMGMRSWYIRCQKGDPEGCNDGTWIIERLEDNTDECYVLCTKDSNGNCLTAGSFKKRLRGRRGIINKRRMWLIRKSNSFTDDSNSQLMKTM